jgi:hypothetical protein
VLGAGPSLLPSISSMISAAAAIAIALVPFAHEWIIERL